MTNKLSPGTAVTCTYRMPPEDQPWTHPVYVGVVLATDDPTAWLIEGHDPQALAAKFGARRYAAGMVPVRYTFGVRWETASCLRVVLDVTAEGAEAAFAGSRVSVVA